MELRFFHSALRNAGRWAFETLRYRTDFVHGWIFSRDDTTAERMSQFPYTTLKTEDVVLMDFFTSCHDDVISGNNMIRWENYPW